MLTRTLETVAWYAAAFVFVVWFYRYTRKPAPAANEPASITPRVPVTGDLFA